MHCEVRSSLQAACAIGHRPLPGEGAAPSPSALDQPTETLGAKWGVLGVPAPAATDAGGGSWPAAESARQGFPGRVQMQMPPRARSTRRPRPPPTWLSPTQKTRLPRLRHTRAPPGCAAARQKVKEQREARSRLTVASTKAAGRRPQRAHRYK